MREFMLQERQSIIYQRLQGKHRVLASDLATEFGVSEDTIRRDLRDMAAAGLCQKVYGGALPVSSITAAPIKERLEHLPDRKKKLASAAISHIDHGSTVFFDAGTTNLAIAVAWPDNTPLNAVTNAPDIAAILSRKAAVHVIMIGGMINKSAGGSLGAKAIQDMELLSPDLCILGACGVDAQAGITAVDFEDAQFKRLVASKSKSVMTAATSDKLNTAAPYCVLPISQCTRLVIEHDADPVAAEKFRVLGCDVVFSNP